MTEPFDEKGIGDGLIVTFRTRGYIGEYNEGHGVIEAIYNGSSLNATFMGDKLRNFNGDPIAVSVHKDPAGLSVYFDGVHVLAATVPEWAPAVGWAFGFGARTGDRKDDHWIDDLRVQSASCSTLARWSSASRSTTGTTCRCSARRVGTPTRPTRRSSSSARRRGPSRGTPPSASSGRTLRAAPTTAASSARAS